jgi:hypothetical protein
VETTGPQKGAHHDRRNPKGQDRGAHRAVAEDGNAGVRGGRQRLLAGGGERSRGSPRISAPAGAFDALVGELAERVADVLEGRLEERLAGLAERASPRLLDRRGLATALGVCADTVDKLRKEGLPTIMVVDSPRFDLEGDVLPWLKNR